MPVRLLPTGVAAIYGIGAFGRKDFATGLTDHVLTLFQPLFPFALPKAKIAASLVAVFLGRHGSIEGAAAALAGDPANRVNEVHRASIKALIQEPFLQFFLVLLFPKTVAPHDLSPPLRSAARLSASGLPPFSHPAS